MRWFLPRNDVFFDLLERSADNVAAGAARFRAMLDDFEHLASGVEDLKRIEHEGDTITHDTIGRLYRSFITPFDREDIHLLISRLDDVLDVIDAAGRRMLLYRVEQVPEGLVPLADVVVAASRELVAALKALRTRAASEEARRHCVEINRLENEGDQIYRAAIAHLFDGHHEAIEVIKAKEILELIEKASDRCEDVADAIEAIVIKGA